MSKKNGGRKAEISRQTRETKVRVALNLDGAGRTEPRTGVGFFDHMLDLLGRHSLIDLSVQAEGDLQVDAHHTVEDVGIVIGQALEQALGDKRGIHRYGAFVFKVNFTGEAIGAFPTELVEEFFKSIATNGKMNLHIHVPYGGNNHHIAEAIFKATARALRQAVTHDPRNDEVPSTKGSLA
jgi:imidazoleglycerol-phosphate dehydratase